MISESDIERYLDDWLGNTPMDPADRVVVSVAVRIQRQRQRPAPLITWGRITTFARLATGAAAVVLVAVIAFAISRPGPGPGQLVTPPPQPTATSTAPAASPSPTPQNIGVSLVGGLPAEWTITASGLLSFRIEADDAWMSVELLPNRLVMDEGCAFGPQAGVGSTADAIISELAERRGLTASATTLVDVGGLHGRQIDLDLDTAVGATCPGEDTPFVPLFGRNDGGAWGFVGLVGTEQIRLIALDVPDGQNVVVMIVANDAAAWDRYVDDADTIVKNLVFEIGL